MEIGKNWNQQQGNSHLGVILALCVGAVLAMYFGTSIGSGDYKTAYLLGLMLIAFPAFVAVGANYWIFIPFAISSYLPAVPIGGRSISLGELACFGCAVAFSLRMLYDRPQPIIARKDFAFYLLFVAFVGVVFAMNPIGFAILGGSSIGARSYLQIFLGVVSFYIIIHQEITEKRAKWVIIGWGAAALLSTFWMVLNKAFLGGTVGGQVGVVSESYYSWHQELRHMPTFVVAYIFSHYGVASLISNFRLKLILTLFVCGMILIFSGKREATASAGIFMAVGAFGRREFGIMVLASLLGLGLLMTLSLGQGRVFDLPKTAQRALVFLPGDWDPDVKAVQTQDTFRESLNTLAYEKFRKNVWLGSGYGTTVSTLARASGMSGGGMHYLAHEWAAASNWHNVWLGTAADFGFPAAVALALLYLQLIVISVGLLSRLKPRSHSHTLVMLILCYTVARVAFGWVQGHTSIDFFLFSWKFAIVVGLRIKSPAEATVRRQSPIPQPVGFNREMSAGASH